MVGEPGPVCSTTIAWRLLVTYNERKHSFCNKQSFCFRFNIMALLLVYNFMTANNDEIQYDKVSTEDYLIEVHSTNAKSTREYHPKRLKCGVTIFEILNLALSRFPQVCI